MAVLRRVLLFTVILLMPAMAGCSLKDWYNQNGTVVLELAPQGVRNTSLDNFRSIKIAVYGASVQQAGVADAKHFTFGDDPRIIDLVPTGKAGERIPIARFTVNLRAVETVVLRAEVIEAIDAGGKSMQVCRLRDTVERFPCFFMPDNGAFLYDEKPFAPPRGGEVVVGFPLAVKYAVQGRKSQYYLDTPPELITLENRR